MVESAVLGYYTFFDQKLRSNTAIVLLVAVLICIVGLLHQVEASSLTGDVLQVSQQVAISDTQIIMIDGISYQVSFQKIGN